MTDEHIADVKRILYAFADCNMNATRARQKLEMTASQFKCRMGEIYRVFRYNPYNFWDLSEMLDWTREDFLEACGEKE
jgi:hypothetical protein